MLRLALIERADEHAAMEPIASIRDLMLAVASPWSRPVYRALARMEYEGWHKAIPRGRGEGRANRYALKWPPRRGGAEKYTVESLGIEELAGQAGTRSTVYFIDILSCDASYGRRPLIVTLLLLLAFGPLPLDALAKVRGRAPRTTREHLAELARYNLAAEDERGWHCPAPVRGMRSGPLFDLARDADTVGAGRRLVERIERERRRYRDDGHDDWAERRERAQRGREAGRMKREREAREREAAPTPRDNQTDDDPWG
jgi:hypothetical protein